MTGYAPLLGLAGVHVVVLLIAGRRILVGWVRRLIGAAQQPPKRWVRPIEEPQPIDPHVEAERLVDLIARRSQSYVAVLAGDVTCSARLVPDLRLERRSYYLVRVGEHEGPAGNEDDVYQIVHDRLVAIVRERAEQRQAVSR